MPEPSIHRAATRSDLPQIVAIYNSTIPSRIVTADTEPVSVESRVSWFEEHTPNRRPLWVVEDAGRVVAWLSFSSFYGRPAYAKTAELSVYVHEAFRKRDRKSTRLNSSHSSISYAVFCLKKKKNTGYFFGVGRRKKKVCHTG